MAASIRYSQIFFGLSLLLVLYVFYRMMEPFLVSVILSLTIVSLTYPLYDRLRRRLKGYSSLSALIMCTVVTLLIILPATLFFVALFNELNAAYVSFRMKLASGELSQFPSGDPNGLLNELWTQMAHYLGFESMNLTLGVSSLIDYLGRYLLDHYSSILGQIGSFVLNFSVMIFSMFFFFRDGHRLLEELKKLIPLEPRYEEMVLAKLKEVTHAVFFGIIATGICQGLAAGLIFVALGIGNPILWATATAFVSLVPVVGTAIVWVPMSVYLMVSGSVLKGIVLLVLGASVIGMVDNFVRPLIIEGRAEGMHLLLVFFSLAGGVFLFGTSGLVLGPLVGALLVTFLEIYKMEFGENLS